MKKLNVKKLNQYFLSGNNSAEMKELVKKCADNFVIGDVPNPLQISLLSDLGLLLDA
jgi:hypothetical protein